MTPSMIYITCGSIAEAEAIAKHLLDKRLVACANILPGMRSMYHWQGSIESAEEVVLILKSVSEKFVDIRREVMEYHSYDTPCIVEYKMSNGLPEYFKWMEQEIK